MTLFDVIMISILGVLFVGVFGLFSWALWSVYKLERKLGVFMGVRVWQGEDNPDPYKGVE